MKIPKICIYSGHLSELKKMLLLTDLLVVYANHNSTFFKKVSENIQILVIEKWTIFITKILIC